MAKAKKLPSGSWRVRVYAGKDSHGKEHYKSFTSPDKKEAEYQAAQFALTKKISVKQCKTIGEAIDDYITAKNNILSPSTIRGYKINAKMVNPIADVSIDKISQEIVQSFINDLAAEKSAKTCAAVHSLIVSSLRFAGSDFKLNTSLPKRIKKIRELPPPELIYIAVKDTDIELPCLLAMWEGMRMSEIRGLRKSDISNGYATIQNTIVTVGTEEIEKEATKTYDSTRKIRLPEYIINLINNVQGEYITSYNGKQIYDRFIRRMKHVGVTGVRFHDLRHVNASVMLQLGVPDKYAMERGGWSSPAILKSIYQHTFTSERDIVDSKIDNFFEKIVSCQD